jgi:hypothetical protein
LAIFIYGYTARIDESMELGRPRDRRISRSLGGVSVSSMVALSGHVFSGGFLAVPAASFGRSARRLPVVAFNSAGSYLNKHVSI